MYMYIDYVQCVVVSYIMHQSKASYWKIIIYDIYDIYKLSWRIIISIIIILNITRQYIPIKIHIDSFIKFVHISYFTKLGKEEGVETHPVRIF